MMAITWLCHSWCRKPLEDAEHLWTSGLFILTFSMLTSSADNIANGSDRDQARHCFWLDLDEKEKISNDQELMLSERKSRP